MNAHKNYVRQPLSLDLKTVVYVCGLVLWVSGQRVAMAAHEIEGNDTLATASAAPLGADTTASLEPQPGVSSDRDFFAVTVTQPGRLRASITSPPSNMRAEIAAYSRHATWMYLSTYAVNDGDNVHLDIDITEPGTYFLRVQDSDGETISAGYALRPVLTPANDIHEPNNIVGEGALMPTASVNGFSFPGGDTDYYDIFVSAGNTLNITLTPPSAMRPAVHLYNPRNTYMFVGGEAANAGDTLHVNHAVTESGIYHIRVGNATGAALLTPYQLTVANATPGFMPPFVPGTTEAETNNRLSEASAIQMGVTITGATAVPGDEDWYAFRPTQTGQLAIAFTSLPPAHTLRAELYTTSGSLLVSGQSGLAGGIFSMVYDITQPQKYLLRVRELNNRSDPANYTFTLTQTLVTDPHEPNNNYGDATPWNGLNRQQQYIFNTGDEDWYRVTVPAPTNLTITMSELPANLSPRLVIVDMSRNQVAAKSGAAGTDLTLTYAVPAAGQYNVVAADAGNNDESVFTYSLTAFGPSFSQFVPIAGIGSITPGAIVVGGSVQFTGSGVDTDGSVVAYEWTSSIDGVVGASATFSTTALSLGTHTIRFRVRDNAGLWSTYVTEKVYVGSAVSDEIEDNGAPYSANEVGLGLPVKGKISVSGDRDFYRVYIPEPGRFTFDISTVPTNLRLEISFYNQNWDWMYMNTIAPSPGDDVSQALHVTEPSFLYIRVDDYHNQAAPGFTYTALPGFIPVNDTYEPNNSFGDATVPATANLSGYMFPESDYDYFKVWVPQGDTLTARVDSVAGDLHADIFLYDRNQTYTFRGQDAVNAGDAVEAEYTAPTDGFVYMRVSANGGANGLDPYNLILTGGVPGFQPDRTPSSLESEPNNEYAASDSAPLSTPISGSIDVNGDLDWFRFEIPSPCELHVALSDVPGNVRGRLDLYDDNRSRRGSAQATNPGDAFDFKTTIIEPGVYYVTVDEPGAGVSADRYTLTITPVYVEDVYEPNNRLPVAAPLSAQNRIQGYIFNAGDVDWYCFAVTTTQAITVSCADVPSELRPELAIYDHTGTRHAHKLAGIDGQSLTLSHTVANTGTWYVAVNQVGNGVYATTPYTLLVQGGAFNNYTPVARIDSMAPNPTPTNGTVTLTGSGDDADGSIIAYEWSSSMDGVFSAAPVVSGENSLTPGIHTITFRVKDNDQNWSPAVSDTLFFHVPAPAEMEPNNIAGSSTLATIGTQYLGEMTPGGDIDWFRISVPSVGRLTLNIDTPAVSNNQMRSHIVIYGRDIEYLYTTATAANVLDPLSMDWDILEPGTYYFKVSDYHSRDNGRYTLRADFQAVPDAYEPNADAMHAAPIALDTDTTAFMFPGAEDDWFSFSAATPGRFDVALIDAPANLRMVASIYNEQVGWIFLNDNANNEGDDVFLIYNIPNTGVHYLRVEEYDNDVNLTEPYRLRASFTGAPDPFEPNNTFGDATVLRNAPVQAYLFAPGEYDYYCIQATGAVSAVVDNVPTNLRFGVAIYNADHGYITQSEATNEGDAVTLNYAASAGRYYLRVRERDGDGTADGTYRLSVSGADLGYVDPTTGITEETEPNDAFSQAQRLAPQGATGRLGSDYDWFYIDATGEGLLSVQVDPPADSRPLIDVYDQNGSHISGRTSENKGEANLLEASIAVAGRYFARVRDADSANSTNMYTVRMWVQYNNDPYEPNNSFGFPATLSLGLEQQATIFPNGDVDVFSAYLPGPGTLHVNVTNVPPNLRMYFGLQNDNNANVTTYTQDIPGDDLVTEVEITQADIYHLYLRERDNNRSSVQPYSLLAQFTAWQDTHEPNNGLHEATLLAAENRSSGLIQPRGDADWYCFSVTNPGPARVQLTDTDGFNARVTVFDDSVNALATWYAMHGGDTLDRTVTLASQDTYYIRVDDQSNDQVSTRPYILTIDAGAFVMHYPIASFDHVTPAPALDSDTVSLRGMGAGRDGSITRYRWSSDRQGVISTSPDPMVSGLSQGLHRLSLEVEDNQGLWSAPAYRRLHVTDTILREAEFNNAVATANPLPLNTWVTGQLNPGNEDDFYRFYVGNCGLMTLLMDPVPDPIRGELSLYDGEGNWMYSTRSGQNVGDYVPHTLYMNPGWYHVRVESYHSVGATTLYGFNAQFNAGADRFEPNDSASTAATIATNSIETDLTLCPAGDLDWFCFDLETQGRLSLAITNMPASARFEMHMYNASHAYIYVTASARYKDSDLYLQYDVPSAGLWYVRVKDVHSTGNTEPYELANEFVPVQDAYEPNNSFGHTTPLTAPLTTGTIFPAGDYDYFVVYADAGTNITLSITNVPDDMRVDLDLYNEKWDYLWAGQSADNDGDEIHLSYTPTASGLLYLRIYDVDGHANLGSYTLNVTGARLGYIPPFSPQTTETEDNSTFNIADDIALDTSLSGRVLGTGDDDYFRTWVNAPGVLRIAHMNVPSNVTSEIRVYNQDISQIDYRRTTNPAESNTLDVAITLPGYYYVRVRDYGNNDSNSNEWYDLQLSHISTDDPYEPNNSLGEAAGLGSAQFSARLYAASDEDWYQLYMRHAGDISVSLPVVPGDLRPRVYIYSPDGANLGSWVHTNPGTGGSNVLVRTVAAAGMYYLRVDNEDSGYSTGQYTVSVTGPDFTTGPQLMLISNRTLHAEVNYIIHPLAHDPDTPEAHLEYSAQNLPPNAAFDPATRTFSWMPTRGQAGTYPNVRFSVTDGVLAHFEEITLTVVDINDPPVLDPIGPQAALAGRPIQFVISGSDPNPSNAVSFSAASLPSGATFDTNTHMFAWVPTSGQGGQHANIFFQITDGDRVDYEYISIIVTVPTQTYEMWRQAHFDANTITNAAVAGDDADPDGDLMTNLEEYLADTDPTNSLSTLRVDSATLSNGVVRIAIQGGVNAQQYLVVCPSLTQGPWYRVFTNTPPTSRTFSFDRALLDERLYYRIEVERR